MSKVVYFDLWTKGIRCFKPIDLELKQKGIETKLIHFGSFSEPCAKEEIINGINVFDISYYNTNFIYKALEKEKPSAVISLNTTFVWDRALVLACRELNIPCYFAMHGDFFLDSELETSILNDKKRNTIFNKVPKLYKYVRFHVLNYFYSYFKSKKKPYSFFTLFKILYINFKNPAKERYLPEIPIDLIFDKAFVYSNAYIKHYEKVGYNKNNIIVTGYPEYDHIYHSLENNLFSSENLPNEILKLVENNEQYALYLDTAYADDNFYGWNNSYRNTHLTEISEHLKTKNIKLVVKIHPTNTEIKDININSDNFIIIKHADLATLSNFCYFAIIHASTSNNIPLILNKPLVAPKWGLSAGIPNRLPKGIAYEWSNLNDEYELIMNSAIRSTFIAENIPRINNTNASTIIVNEILKNN